MTRRYVDGEMISIGNMLCRHRTRRRENSNGDKEKGTFIYGFK